MQDPSNESVSDVKIIDFGYIPVETVAEKYLSVQNLSDKSITYRVSLMYLLDIIDKVFKVSITSTPVQPMEYAQLKVTFSPHNANQSFTEYYIIDDTGGNAYRLTVTGRGFGPNVSLSSKILVFNICKNINEQRREVIKIVNRSSVETTYQWLLPLQGQGYFQISTGNCGLIKAYETITATIMFTGIALGMYTAELVCLVLNQEPIFLNVVATVILPGNPLFNIYDHIFQKNFKNKRRFTHLMENSLNRLDYEPAASVFDRFLDFGMGSVKNVTLNISQTLCITNHGDQDGYIHWMPDPDNIFLIDPISSSVPAKDSKLFTVRFRPKTDNEVYGYLLCGDYQQKMSNEDSVRIKHTWFRIPCTGHTWCPCTEWTTEWSCPHQLFLPPTVPRRTTFVNFMLSNKLEIPMYFKFEAPIESNFVMMPMCGIVQSRGWQIITVALEPQNCGNYYENWDLIINKVQKARVTLFGNAELSQIEVMSHGYNPATHGMYEFPPTITGCTNYVTAYLHNLTRMDMHLRVLSNVSWLGGDNCGAIVIPAREIVCYRWWFFPKVPDKVYDTTVTISSVCLLNGRPVGEVSEIFIHIYGFSEVPDLRVLPKTKNLNDIIVGDSETLPITLYNNSSCVFTSKLYHEIDGMGDDFSKDRLDIYKTINTLKPSKYCEITLMATPAGAGPRQIDIKYTILFRTEFDEIEEIQPITKAICTVWYDGIYPTLKVTRTISLKCPMILSNHCVWNILNTDELNKALEECRPHKPLKVNLYAPDLCTRSGNVEWVMVFSSLFRVPVAWSLRREKICNCEMVEVQTGLSWYEKKHTCYHRSLVELSPANGIVSESVPEMLHMKFDYSYEGHNVLCYLMSMPNDRSIRIYIHINGVQLTKGKLAPLRRVYYDNEHLAVLDCGRVPINNLDPVIRIVWLYNPTDVYTTWRLLKGNTVSQDSPLRCLLYFAEIPPLGKLAIPFSFMPTEMVDYEMIFLCSFGYDTMKILVKGQGGLPNCIETRLDMPKYVDKISRAMNRLGKVHLTHEHITVPIMPTHNLSRDVVAICNNTDSVMRFIWLPERIANIINVVMTPCWGVVQPRSCEWITMTIYSLQEPATFTTVVACEILDLTARRKYQRNEFLRRNKIEKCNQEFIITEHGSYHPDINDSPPYVLDLEKPQPFYLAMTVSVSSKGQRDGYHRMLLRQLWEKTPPYDLLSSDLNDHTGSGAGTCSNSMTMVDILRLIDSLLWETLHSKMFKYQLQYYSKEEIPTPKQLIKVVESDVPARLSLRVTSGICDAIVNKAIFHIYKLHNKHEMTILEAE